MSGFTPGEPLVALVALTGVTRLGKPAYFPAGVQVTYLRDVTDPCAVGTWHVGEIITDFEQCVVTFRPHQVTRPNEGPQAA